MAPHPLCLPPAGDIGEMDEAAELWKEAAELLELLRQDPDEFVRQHGYDYDIYDV